MTNPILHVSDNQGGIMVYLKAIVAYIGAVCLAIGSAAATGHLNLVAILVAIGGALAPGGAVAAVTNKGQVALEPYDPEHAA